MSVREISPAELQQMLDTDQPPLLVDVREPWEARIASIRGSTLLPMSSLRNRWQELPRDRALALYCHHGMRSLNAAEFLAHAGYEALSLSGGIERWAREIEPGMRRY